MAHLDDNRGVCGNRALFLRCRKILQRNLRPFWHSSRRALKRAIAAFLTPYKKYTSDLLRLTRLAACQAGAALLATAVAGNTAHATSHGFEEWSNPLDTKDILLVAGHHVCSIDIIPLTFDDGSSGGTMIVISIKDDNGDVVTIKKLTMTDSITVR